MNFIEVIVILILGIIVFLIIGPARIGRFFGEIARMFREFSRGLQEDRSVVIRERSVGGIKNGLSWVLATVGLIGGYMLGSAVLPMLSFTAWERHVVATNNANYTSALREAFSGTALLGGIIGAIIFAALGLFIARQIKK